MLWNTVVMTPFRKTTDHKEATWEAWIKGLETEETQETVYSLPRNCLAKIIAPLTEARFKSVLTCFSQFI